MTERLPITPETRVAELLEAYPELEDVLIREAPAFKALRNPVLRRTVAKVATLEKAARVGGIPIRQLVVTLRQAAGLPVTERDSSAAAFEESTPETAVAAPEWLDESRVRITIDADVLLEAGELPLARVQDALRGLSGGELVRILSTFRPEPLIEALEKQKVQVYVVNVSPGRFVTYVHRGREG